MTNNSRYRYLIYGVLAFAVILGIYGVLSGRNDGRQLEALDRTLPDTYSNGCHLAVTESVLKPCYGDENGKGPLIYLVGDSHAAQWVPALEVASRANIARFRFITKSSCPYVSLQLNKNCEKWIKNVTEDILTNKPSTVILSSMTNAQYFSPLNEAAYSKLWLDNFRTLQNRIMQATQIVLIEDTPYSHFDSSECLLSRRASDCNFDLRQSSLTQLLKSYSSAQEITVLSFNKYLCKQNQCTSGDSRINYYRDAHHISVGLSTRLGGELTQSLKAILINDKL